MKKLDKVYNKEHDSSVSKPDNDATLRLGLEHANDILKNKSFRDGESFWTGIKRILNESMAEMKVRALQDTKNREAQQAFDKLNNTKKLK
jgi:predicted component of type VI protein secretion system